mgnify:CR=1 FL=1
MREMKDSGIEWIGKIPAHWALSKVGMFYNIVLGKMLQSEQSSDSDTYEKYLCAMNLGNNALKYDVLKKMWFSEKERQQYKVQKGDLIVVEGGDVASCDIVKEDVSDLYIQNALHRVRAKKDFTLEFLKYSLMMAKAQGYISLICNKATIAHFTKDKFSSLPFLAVPVDEQLKIVQVLDKKCAQVDALITNIQTQIEKLKAYKQSMITEVVTKGLDPTVPMKDSGVEWIGEIPAYWKIQRGKALFKETEARSADGSEELLTVSQYTGITPRSQKNVTMFEALSLEGYNICEIGDIAANTMWLWAGAIGVSEYRGVVSPSYNVYRQRSNNFAPRYLDHLLRAPMLVQEYASRSTGIRASRLRLYPKDFFNIMFPVPPLEEQQAILDALNSKLSAVDRLIAIKQAKIEKLEQYKRSLIYEYVTGKREVSCDE